jgi:GT2 family glycosyltransferase
MVFSIIIVNYNLSSEVNNCINSLTKNTNGSEFEIILVDNHSEDESILRIAEEFSKDRSLNFKFVRTEENIGFGKACNLAVKHSRGELLFFLNPDTTIKENILKRMNEEMEKHSLDYNKNILGFNVSNQKLFDFSAGIFPNYFIEFLNVFSIGRFAEAAFVKIRSVFSSNKVLRLDWVMGSSLLIGRESFLKIGGFDPNFFLYFEEMDLCRRAKNNDMSVLYFRDIRIDHIGSVSAKKNYYFFTKMFYKGKLLFLKKHSKNLQFYIFQVLLFFHIIFQIVFMYFLMLKNSKKSLGKIRAFREILSNLNYPEGISNTP